MKKIFEYKGTMYPTYIREGDACAYCLPVAQHFCTGEGLDIGGFNKWTFPGARAINITLDDEFDAYNLPKGQYDYIFSSHTLEHLPDYIKALEYWKSHLKDEGVLFLYLPHPDMEYWRPENNRKHLHLFHPEDLKKSLENLGYKNIIMSERDMYWSFSIIAFT